MRIVNFISNNKILILVLIVGLFLRLWNYQALYMYSHDQDLQAWMIKDVLVNHHFRLIGQETSTHGIFIGPLFYYLLIPFYLLTHLDPIGGVFMTVLLGMFGIWSFYFCFAKIFSKRVGLISALMYSTSFYTVFNDREVVPTMPVIIWTVWFLYALYLVKQGNQKWGYILSGLLIGLIWHLNMALILLLPLIVVSQFISRRKVEFKNLASGFAVLFAISIPLVLFELRHNFSQVSAFIISLTTNQRDALSGVAKFQRLIYLIGKDLAGLVWGSVVDIKYEELLVTLIIVWVYLVAKKVIKKDFAIFSSLWFLLYLAFFSLYSKVISEYYLNGLIVVWIAMFALGINSLLRKRKTRILGFMVLCIFVIINFYRIFTIPINESGYIQRKGIIAEIKKDSNRRGYPCASVSYITDPGYNLGYRYLIWIRGLKLRPISETVPVYTIVYPLKPIFKTDRNVGAIGLIYPDYGKYKKDVIEKNCQGDDYNLTDSMFGYTD